MIQLITSSDEVYEIVRHCIGKCRDHGYADVAQQLDDAMHLGSSGLEILGALRFIFTDQAKIIEQFVDKQSLRNALAFISTLYK